MIRLTKVQTEILLSISKLKRVGQRWFQTEAILLERMKGREYDWAKYCKSTEKVLERLFNHVPRLVERRVIASGYSWSLTLAGQAVAETQLGENE